MSNSPPSQRLDIRGFFSSERSLHEFCDSIWKAQPLKAEITYSGQE
ncbi:MAG: hypothetical protein AB8A39_01415 [Prochlorococcus sp.]|nr:hypothetical protein [Prochlorococcaceae cyanobacterium Fu_MAG_50]